jgi:Amino acid transporters
MSSTKELKRVLGRRDLFGMAMGNVIGAGVMALTGIAIGMTGRSVPLSFLIAAFFVTLIAGPSVIIGGTLRLRGGWYTQVGLLLGQKFSGIFLMMFVFTNISIAMYALSFADYFMGLVGLEPVWRKLIAGTTLTVFYVLNVVGVSAAAKTQNVIVVLMCLALALFAGFGVFKIQPGYFEPEGFMTGGVVGLMSAAALVSFAAGGATQIVNFSAEAKNPTKDLPVVIIGATLMVALLYAFISVVAAGVLPLDQVANKPLTAVAKEVLPAPLYVFFMVGGAMFALVSTLNAQLGWATRPIIQACEDGWFPRSLAALGKNKTPYKLLTIYYFFGLIPILAGLDIGTVADYTLVLYNSSMILICVSVVNLPQAVPELWAKSPFHMSSRLLKTFVTLGVIACCIQIYMLLNLFSRGHLYGSIALFGICVLYAFARDKTGMVKVETSYEAN